MFPTEAHMNMGGSIHGGAVMSFIDMAMFAGGLCAGMERGHYVTLDLTTHFLARGQAGVAARCPCRAGQADRAATSSFRASCEQDGEPCYSFTGTLKRVHQPNGPGMTRTGRRGL